MPATNLRPLSRKGSRRKPDFPLALKPARRPKRQAMIDQRDRCIAELARFRNGLASNCFFEKALQLLTRHWSASSWHVRAEILRTAEWLIQVGSQAPYHLNLRAPLPAAE
jgi:hypothetical protein